MAFKRLSPYATYVERGFGQVEPNHLSARRTAEIYAQLPADASINILENGQFVKYNYAKGVVDFDGIGEWMLVFNEVKVYDDRETDEDFAMIRRDYVGTVYSPIGVTDVTNNGPINPLLKTIGANSEIYADGHLEAVEPTDANYAGIDPTQGKAFHGADFGRNHLPIGNKYEIEQFNEPQIAVNAAIPMNANGDWLANGIMTPRVFKTHEGDIFTTNTIAETTLAVGDLLQPTKASRGYLKKTVNQSPSGMVWQVVKVYNLGDLQRAVKVMRVQ